MRRSLLAAAAAALLAPAAPAFADVHIVAENCASCSNVHLIDQVAGDNVVNGETFNGSGISLTATGIEPLADTSPGNGQAWVGAVDGTLTYLDLAIQGGYTFTDLGFNLNEQNLSGNPDWFVTLTGFDLSGPTSQSFTLSHNTDFHIYTTNSQVLTHVQIQQITSIGGGPLDEGADSALDGVGQIKIGGVSALAVPEPASWALMITGFAGMGALLRRRRAEALLA